MAVDLGDLVERARNEVSVPGGDLLPAANDEHWISHLASAFWNARLNGWFAGYTEADGIISPETDGDDDLSGRDQQLVVLHCAYHVVRNQLLQLRTRVKQQAGPVSQDVERSAMVLRDILKDLREKLAELRKEEVKAARCKVAAFDAAFLRHDSLSYGDTSWLL